jgi:TolB protein
MIRLFAFAVVGFALIGMLAISIAGALGGQIQPDLLLIQRHVDQRDVWTRQLALIDVERGMFAPLTRTPGLDVRPSWSPDGERIVFESMREGKSEIYIMGAFGREIRRMTHTAEPFLSYMSRWSPDGKHLAYFFRQGEFSALFVLDTQSGIETRLSEYAMVISPPSWSPDSTRLVYGILFGPSAEITLASAAGQPERFIASSPAYDTSPAWSPDGRWIAFLSDRDTVFSSRLVPFLYDPLTEDVRRLTSAPDVDYNALTWSPDGGALAAMVYPRTGHLPRLILIDPNTGDERILLDGRTRLGSPPAWSPDGTRIAIASGTPLASGVLIADLNGETRHIYIPGIVESVAWRPRQR